MDSNELHIKQFPHDECTQLFYHDYENKQHEFFEARNTEIQNNYQIPSANALQLRPHQSPYTCLQCGAVFRSVEQLTSHMESHTTQTAYKCNYCKYTTVNLNEMKMHVKTHIYTAETSHFLGRKKDQHINATQITIALRYKESQPADKTNQATNTSSSDLVYICNMCQQEFFKMQAVIDHIVDTHIQAKPGVKCTNCGKCCQSEKALEYHMKQHDRELRHACTACDKRFHTRHGLRHHMKINAEGKFHKCEYCAAQFRGYGGLRLHLRAHKTDAVHTCRYCNQIFKSLNGLKCHTRLHTGETDLYGCTLCGRRYRLSSSLKSHMMHFHGSKARKSSQLLQCPQCDKHFKTRLGLNVHTRSHSLEGPYECHHCAKHFRAAGNLKYHMHVHAEGIRDDKELLECQQCSKRFKTPAGLKFHTRVHTVKLPHKCTECAKGFRKCSDLQNHLLVHKGEYPFRCSICGQIFRGKTGFAMHKEAHLNDKDLPYACVKCGRRFRERYHREEHFRRVHRNEFKYHCNECDRKFNCKTSLDRHQLIHNEEMQPKCKLCGKVFAGAFTMHKHMRTIHERAPKKCPYCDMEFYMALPLKLHIRSHTGERPFVCDFPKCNVKLKTQRGLLRHKVAHSEGREYKCDRCGKEWDSKVRYSKHDCKQPDLDKYVLKNDCNESGFAKQVDENTDIKCAECGKVYHRKYFFQFHVNSHTKPYKCDRCGRGWSTSYLRKKHVCKNNGTEGKQNNSAQNLSDLDAQSTSHMEAQSTSHMEETVLRCKECDKTFRKESCLQQHMRTHRGEKPFECSRCGRQWASWNNYTKHIRNNDCFPGEKDCIPVEKYISTQTETNRHHK